MFRENLRHNTRLPESLSRFTCPKYNVYKMSWVRENCVSFFQLLCIKVVKTGRVPQHIAFIMDGNRRFAKKTSVKTTDGHYKGFDKLSETLKWCLDLGIPEVTVYAFSIENFKRSQDEVTGLMDLARDKFERLLKELDHINEWGIRVHVAGRLTMLPDDLKAAVSRAMLATRHNDKLRLNIAFAYTACFKIQSRMSFLNDLLAQWSQCRTAEQINLFYLPGRDEISRAASHIVEAVNNNEISSEEIDDTLISHTMELGEAELLVRTSGEVRLSDFMLWQVSNTVLYFTDVLWPEFSIWNLLSAIIHFQRYAPEQKESEDLSESKLKFLENLEKKRWRDIETFVSC